jgi:hypothetical protein
MRTGEEQRQARGCWLALCGCPEARTELGSCHCHGSDMPRVRRLLVTGHREAHLTAAVDP